MSDDIQVAEIARRAAARLAAGIDPGLPNAVEESLAEDPLERRPERLVDPISLGGLIVSLVSFGWTVYRDIKKDRASAGLDRAGQTERLSARLQEDGPEAVTMPARMTPEQQSQILRVVAEEIVETGD